ncbi:MAG: hypothetical protein WBN40_05230 [Pseudomonadales bacterium]
MARQLIKPHEYWHPRVYEFPFYLYLLSQCARKRVSVRGLAKANYALDHGEIGIGSKFQTQFCFPQQRFMPTILLEQGDGASKNLAAAMEFAGRHAFPLILKPNIGMVGKGIVKIHSEHELALQVAGLRATFLLQKYCELPEEYGVFYTRLDGQSRITGINKKHFPSVQGDGKTSLAELAEKHERYSHHWATFLRYLDLASVPANEEHIKLSFIGSHTMGCMFSDDSKLLSPALEREIFSICDAQPGFNYGRLDVRAASDAAFQQGEFTVIEINGISSLPTHMFDPVKSLRESYEIFFRHGKYLTEIAREHRQRDMPLLPPFTLLKKVVASQRALDELHERLKTSPQRASKELAGASTAITEGQAGFVQTGPAPAVSKKNGLTR